MAQLRRFWLGRLSGGIVRGKRLDPRHFGWLGECDPFYRPIGSQTEANCGVGVIGLAVSAESALEARRLLPEGVAFNCARAVVGIARLIAVIGASPFGGAAGKIVDAPWRFVFVTLPPPIVDGR